MNEKILIDGDLSELRKFLEDKGINFDNNKNITVKKQIYIVDEKYLEYNLHKKELFNNKKVLVISNKYNKNKELFFFKLNFVIDYIHIEGNQLQRFEIIYLKILNLLKILNYHIYETNEFKIDLMKETIFYKEKKVYINLIGKQYQLFLYLLKNQNKISSSLNIREDLWRDDSFLINPNVLEVVVSKIRKELRKKTKIEFIHTIKSVGYMFKTKIK